MASKFGRQDSYCKNLDALQIDHVVDDVSDTNIQHRCCYEPQCGSCRIEEIHDDCCLPPPQQPFQRPCSAPPDPRNPCFAPGYPPPQQLPPQQQPSASYVYRRGCSNGGQVNMNGPGGVNYPQPPPPPPPMLPNPGYNPPLPPPVPPNNGFGYDQAAFVQGAIQRQYSDPNTRAGYNQMQCYQPQPQCPPPGVPPQPTWNQEFQQPVQTSRSQPLPYLHQQSQMNDMQVYNQNYVPGPPPQFQPQLNYNQQQGYERREQAYAAAPVDHSGSITADNTPRNSDPRFRANNGPQIYNENSDPCCWCPPQPEWCPPPVPNGHFANAQAYYPPAPGCNGPVPVQYPQPGTYQQPNPHPQPGYQQPNPPPQQQQQQYDPRCYQTGNPQQQQQQQQFNPALNRGNCNGNPGSVPTPGAQQDIMNPHGPPGCFGPPPPPPCCCASSPDPCQCPVCNPGAYRQGVNSCSQQNSNNCCVSPPPCNPFCSPCCDPCSQPCCDPCCDPCCSCNCCCNNTCCCSDPCCPCSTCPTPSCFPCGCTNCSYPGPCCTSGWFDPCQQCGPSPPCGCGCCNPTSTTPCSDSGCNSGQDLGTVVRSLLLCLKDIKTSTKSRRMVRVRVGNQDIYHLANGVCYVQEDHQRPRKELHHGDNSKSLIQVLKNKISHRGEKSAPAPSGDCEKEDDSAVVRRAEEVPSSELVLEADDGVEDDDDDDYDDDSGLQTPVFINNVEICTKPTNNNNSGQPPPRPVASEPASASVTSSADDCND